VEQIMSRLFPHLFSPLTLRRKPLANRLVFGGHTPNMAVQGVAGEDPLAYFPGQRMIAYYAERARGGTAMIVVEPIPAHETSVLTRPSLRPGDGASVPHLRHLVEACRKHGALMIQGVTHVGADGDADNSLTPNWSPSGRHSYLDFHGSHAMTEAEIEEVIEGFVRTAVLAKQAGFDGIEVDAGHNTLIEQFWDPLSNRRDDRWGGSLDDRLRFAVRVLEGIRGTVGGDLIVGLAVTGDNSGPGGLDLAARIDLLAHLDGRRLMDYVAVGSGTFLDTDRATPSFLCDEMPAVPAAAAIKKALGHALVVAASGIGTAANAETILAGGMADMVSLIRPQMADPHLANKAAGDRPQEIRPCIACNQRCVGRRARDYWMSCLVNPAMGREFQWGGEPAEPVAKPRRLLVVGAGPAGLEAARVAAERGHRVVLMERTDAVGGQLRLTAAQPGRRAVGELLRWYREELTRLQVEVRLNHDPEAEGVHDFAPDAVIVATGSRPANDGYQRSMPDIERLPGVDDESVFSVDDVLSGAPVPGPRVLLLDESDDWKGAGTALYMAERDLRVSFLTKGVTVAKGLVPTKAHKALRKRFRELAIEEIVQAALVSWSDGRATIKHLKNGESETVGYDSLVLSTTNVARAGLQAALAKSSIEVHAIGDCVAPRTAAAAIFEGRRLALAL
jgi:2,4-dienoyl-CoA reductase-like NADH-dependent reductase (Old Yellow Enzyme family)